MFFNSPKLAQQLEELQEEARRIVITKEGPPGVLRLTVNGLQQVLEVNFGPAAPALMRQGELGALVRDIFNEALLEARRQLRNEVAKKTGLNIPHLPGLF
ncbi:MAG: hypothetical protein PWP72_2197 [Thermoanaerobacter sp.]|uniref:YbaB/EbfC family nucleoid-associated protein n=1 Tax=Desulfofundulus thermocisternus TaxID=42471 RepID=UPI000481F162|nr:YbaB/EbfC family nucleoid-associated protein [Desulfofundulus thermocisternus]MDK2889319.1 hypothetical protein [Thermoanaerobacter sp.]